MKSDYYKIQFDMLDELGRLAASQNDKAALAALQVTRCAVRASQQNDVLVVSNALKALVAWRQVSNPCPYWRAKELLESLAGIDAL